MVTNLSIWNYFRRSLRIALLFCLVFLALAWSPNAQAQSAASREYPIKAAFLFNFAQFIEWPETAFTNQPGTLCFGILGDDPFGEILDETVRGETIRERKLTIRRATKVEDLAHCHIIFISRSEKARIEEILKALSSKPVLTVSEMEGFAEQGGAINFYNQARKVRFEINPAVTRRNGLKVSSELLSLGKIVSSERETK